MNILSDYKFYFHSILLAAFISICYANTLQSAWHLDDIPNIVENSKIQIQSLSWQELPELASSFGFYRPVSYISFALNYSISGLDTTGYHIVNIAIHIICSFFVYLVFLQTLQLTEYKGDKHWKLFSHHDIALFGAALWALHPIQTQAVTYIVQRMTSMACMFFMIAMYCYLRFRLCKNVGKRFILIFLSFFFWITGLFSKENVVLLPIVLIGYEFAFFRAAQLNKRKLALFAAAAIALMACLVFFLTDGKILQLVRDPYSYRPFTMWQRLITEPIILSKYLFLLICPLADFLSLESDRVASSSLISPPYTIVADLFILSLSLFSILFFRRFPVLCFALFFYLVNHLVESSFLGLELYFEHRNYLPSVFIYFALAYYALSIIEHYKVNGKVFMHFLLSSALTAVLISEANATYMRNDIWNTQTSLLEDTIKKSPLNIRPWFSLGAVHIRKNNYDDAEYYLTQAEKLYKEHPARYQDNLVSLLYYNYGILALKEGKSERAIEHLHRSIDINPNATGWSSHLNIGVLYFETGKTEESEKFLRNALKREKKQNEIYQALGRALYANNKFNEAIEIFQKGIAVKETPALKLNLIAAYLKTGDAIRAKQVLSGMRHDPNDLDYLLYRAYLYPGGERERSLNLIARQIDSSNGDLRQWLSEIRMNNYIGIIYPDISAFEDDLIREFDTIMSRN
jgi:tetratricopeptide (TPR) repeat protein